MKHKILLLLFLFSLLPSWGWGQEITYHLDYQFNGLTIDDEYIYTFTGTYNGIPNQNIGDDKNAVINVAKGSEITIKLDNATIDLSQSNGCPLCAKDAKTVNLILIGENTLIAGGECPGIWAPEGEYCGIIIDEESGSSGSLIVKTSSNNYPGIGGEYNQNDNGYITIKGGTINAIANAGAGIGGGKECFSSYITITGGKVAASSISGAGIGGSDCKITITGGTVITNSESGAGIGSGENSSSRNITITGGIVTAHSESGAGIGSGKNSSCRKITITGGIITAFSESGAGIGNGDGGSSDIFYTEDPGTAFINASSISDPSYKDNTNTKGLIFDGNNGAIYGDTYTLAADAKIEKGKRLIIKNGQILTINKDVTLTNNGKILLIGSGSINGEGSVSSNQPVTGFEVTYKLNYEDSPADHIEYVENGGPLPTYNVNRKYYEFDGWYDSETDGAKVTIINKSTTVYAHWKKNEIKVVKSIPIISSSVGTNKFQAYELNNLLDESSYKEGITYNWVIESAEHYGLDIRLNQITGTPDKVTDGKANIKIKISGENCEDQVVDIPIEIEKGNVIFDIDEIYKCIYSGKVFDIEIPVYNYSNKKIGNALVVYYADGDQTKPENSGAIIVGGAPKFAGKYDLYVHYNGDDNYLSSTNTTSKFIISPKELNITPLPNQKLFEDEAPAYEVLGEVNDETPKFTGSLGVESGKVVINSLALTTEFAQNYSLSLTPDIPITIINNETAKSLVQLNGTTNANGAYIDEVIVTAPEGFLIALESSKLKSRLNYTKSFTWNQKGTYDLNYKLKRISDGEESNEFSMEITVVESHYIPDNGGNDNNDSSITEYNVEIPEVEGISVDKGFGDHWIKDWKDFSFIITVKEGYVENSDPEVTIKGYDFEFDALTDTTYECRIDHVFKNAKVTITGIVKDPPATANNAIKAPEESWKIINDVAYITVAKPTEFAVVDMNGNIISTNKLAPGETPIYNLPRAKPIVFWFDKERAVKVIIK